MRKVLTLACVLALLGSGLALAATNSSLKGVVKDAQGAGLPGATVTITSPTQLGGARTTQTEADGSFSFANVDPGLFKVKAELDGFVSQEQEDVLVRAGRTQALEIKMGTGEFEETVQVTAEAPVIDPATAPTSGCSPRPPESPGARTPTCSAPPSVRTPTTSTASTPPIR